MKPRSLSEQIDREIWSAEGEAATYHSEIGYYVGRTNILSLCFSNAPEINYEALGYAHMYWRFLRKYSKTGEQLSS